MKDFLIFVIFGLLTLVLVATTLTGTIVGIGAVNAKWNCARWNEQPEAVGHPARYIAGDCYIRNSKGRLVEFSHYVNMSEHDLHVNDGND